MVYTVAHLNYLLFTGTVVVGFFRAKNFICHGLNICFICFKNNFNATVVRINFFLYSLMAIVNTKRYLLCQESRICLFSMEKWWGRPTGLINGVGQISVNQHAKMSS